MPYSSSVETFIESLAALFSTYPNTRLTITYANVGKKHSKARPLSASHRVTFKCFEPASGKCIKFRTHKIKEVSRLMTFVGPRGVNHDTVKLGLALVMANTSFEGVPVEARESTPVPAAAAPVAESAGVSKSKKKKKGRK